MKHILQACVKRTPELSYVISGPLSETKVKRAVQQGDLLADDKDMKWIATLNKSVRVGYLWTNQRTRLNLFVYSEGKCIGVVEFDYTGAAHASKRFKQKFLTPHVSFLKEFRGLGYPSFIYSLVLNQGFGLATAGHSRAASKLWQSVAQKVGAKIYHYDAIEGLLPKATRSSWQLLSKKALK